MARKEPVVTRSTTVVAPKVLLDRVSDHVKRSDGNQNEFIRRALVNQLEREGDDEIRELMEKENGDEEG